MKSIKPDETNISRYPCTGTEWLKEEDVDLKALILSGFTVARMASRLGRSRSEIRDRISHLALLSLLHHKEQARFARCKKLDQSRKECS